MQSFKPFIFLFVLLLYWFGNINFVTAQVNKKKEYVQDSMQIDCYLKQVEKVKSSSFSDKAKYQKMFDLLNSADLLSKKSGDIVTMYRINDLYSKIYSESNNISIAMNYSFKNLELLEEKYKTQKDTIIEKFLTDTYNTIMISYLNLDNFQKALTYSSKLTHFLESSKLKKYPALYNQRNIVLNNNLASAYLMTDNLKDAEKYYNKALSFLKNNEQYTSYKASIYNNLGIIAHRVKKEKDALDYYNKALTLWEQLKDTAGLAKINNNFGNYYSEINDYNTAIHYLNKAYSYSQSVNNLRSELTAIYNLSKVYLHSSDYKKAYYYTEKVAILKDSLMSSDKIRYITQLELQYQYEKEKREADTKQKINDAENKRKILIYTGVILMLILILLLFALLYRNQQIKNREIALQDENLKLEKSNLELEKKNLEKEIDNMNKELTVNAMYLLKRNELISSTSNKLLTLRMQKNLEERKILRSIVKELKQNINNNSWSEFEVRFKNVHNDFFVNLNEKYPTLTPNEIKICSFLRLNMSTKDISSITLQSVKSIEIARTRLRKKLNIERDENLILFLQKL